MRYNVLALGKERINLYNIADDELQIVIDCYLKGKDSLTISGTRHNFKAIREFQIFNNQSNFSRYEFENNIEEMATGGSEIFGLYYTSDDLAKHGENITKQIIGHKEYGCETIQETVVPQDSLYVNSERISELANIKSSDFDLSKLITMCNELNFNWLNNNYFTVALLLRSIVNHIPPIFGKFSSFDEVIGQYGGASFKKNAKVLNESLRSIADHYTHSLIRRKEPLPNRQQIDFRHSFDFLLTEIVAILH